MTTVAYWPWTLPEDGILDPIAIELAARGIRPVALTPVERITAAARIQHSRTGAVR